MNARTFLLNAVPVLHDDLARGDIDDTAAAYIDRRRHPGRGPNRFLDVFARREAELLRDAADEYGELPAYYDPAKRKLVLHRRQSTAVAKPNARRATRRIRRTASR